MAEKRGWHWALTNFVVEEFLISNTFYETYFHVSGCWWVFVDM